MRRKASWRLLFSVAVLAGFAACRSAGVDPSRMRASGTLEMTEIYLSPNVPGRVQTVTVREGDAVKAGQQVGTLDRFDQAKRDYERSRRLETGGGATSQQTEHAELAWRDQQLISPIDGLVLMRVSEPGEAVTPGTPVVVIGNPKDVWLKVYFSEAEVGRIAVGQPAALQIDSFPGRNFEGRVSYVSPMAEFTPKNVQTKEERATQMFAVKVAVAKPEGLLKPGMPADCEIDTRPAP